MTIAAPVLASPYKGLVPYGEDDARFFFGRDAEQQLIVANLMASRLTLLFGPSGVGKSSLLHAGVAPILRAQSREHLQSFGTPESAVILFSSWRDDPVAALTEAAHATVRQAWHTSDVNGATAQRPREHRLTETLQACAEFVDGDLVVILDQFEEYFLYHGNEDGEGTFAAELPRALSTPGLRASFLISIRDDALAKLDRFEGQIPNLFTNFLRIEHLDREAARAAIVQPINRFNALHAAQVGIEPELVEAVLDQVRMGQVRLDDTGRGTVEETAEQIETPYLQLVMTRLWAEDVTTESSVLSRATLDRLGGAEEIVRTHLDATMAAMSLEQRDVAAQVFHYLVTPSGSKIAHSAADLAEYTALPHHEVGALLEGLSSAGARVLLPIAPPMDQPDIVRYEIFHDVLGAPVLDWRRRYVQAQERAAAERQLIAERRRVWRLRAMLTGALILLVGVVALSLFAVQQRDAARNAERIAFARGLASTALAQQAAHPDLGVLLAIEAADGARSAQTEDALRTVLLDPARAVLRGHSRRITSVSFSPSGELVATTSLDGTAKLWSTRSGEPVADLTGHTRAVTGAAFSPDGRLLATAGEDNVARVWDVAGQRRLLEVGGHAVNVYSAFSANGSRLVTSSDTSARVWELPAGTGGADLRGHIGLVTDASLRPDGQRVVTASRDGTARVWDASTGAVVVELVGHRGSVESAAFSPDGARVLTASRDGTARVWDGASGRMIVELRGHTGAVTSATFSPDGSRILTASEDTTARLWDAANGRRLAEMAGHGGFVTSARFSQDGRFIVTGSSDKVARIWNIGAEQHLLELRGHAGGVTGSAFNPTAGLVVTGSEDGTARIWTVDVGAGDVVFQGHTGWLTAAILSPDGGTVLTGSLDGSARLWNATTGGLTRELRGHSGLINNAVFSADGARVATASDDHTARIWDLQGQSLHELTGHRGSVNTVAFSPDGRRVVTASLDTTARVWDAASGAR